MSVLTTHEAKMAIEKEVFEAKGNLHIISAFCKTHTLKTLIDGNLSSDKLIKKLLVRFLPTDILSGATDLKLYEYCKKHNWEMYVNIYVHAKTYVFDGIRCIVGSNNLTNRGMGIGFLGNQEISTFADLSASDMLKINNLFLSSTKMNDDLYELMIQDLNNNQSQRKTKIVWSDEIMSFMLPNTDTMFSYDFPSTKCPDMSKLESFDFLEIEPTLDKNVLTDVFTKSKCYLWLLRYLENIDAKTAYFGEISAALHNVLVSDPKPFRKDVKVILSNLLSWIEFLNIESIKIDRPSYSQRIQLIT